MADTALPSPPPSPGSGCATPDDRGQRTRPGAWRRGEKLLEHFGQHPVALVLPADDSFGCVPPTEKSDFDLAAVSLATLPGDLQEQAASGRRGGEPRVRRNGRFEEPQPVVEADAAILLVREGARQDEEDFVAVRQGSPGQRQMGAGGRIEGSRQHSEA